MTAFFYALYPWGQVQHTFVFGRGDYATYAHLTILEDLKLKLNYRYLMYSRIHSRCRRRRRKALLLLVLRPASESTPFLNPVDKVFHLDEGIVSKFETIPRSK